MFYRIRIHVLCLITSLCLIALAKAEYTTLVLQTWHVVKREEYRQDQIPGVLIRELGRQALLIAARDELGMLTRDQSVRESGTDNDDELKLLLTVDPWGKQICELNLLKSDPKARRTSGIMSSNTRVARNAFT
jgi:hypothetical protein